MSLLPGRAVGRRLPVLLICALFAQPVVAAESGSGLFVPGSTGFGAGLIPPPGVYATHAAMLYDGKASALVEGGATSIDARKTAMPLILNLTYVPKGDFLGGRVALSASIPYLSYTRLRAEVDGVGRVVTSGWGLGDLSLKTTTGWSSGSFSHNVGVSLWLPTGRYDIGFAPNAGKNHYGVHLGWAFTQIWEGSGVELSGATGVTFEDRNARTRYRNGPAWNLEAAVGVPAGKTVKLGVAGFALRQLDRDGGEGATLGSFAGQGFGIGPALNFGLRIGRTPISASFRHYQEFGVRNRFSGHISTIALTARM